MPIHEFLQNGDYLNFFLCLHYAQHQTCQIMNEWKMDDYGLISQAPLSK